MGYSYDEACEMTFPKVAVILEIKRHQIDPNEFFEEIGEQEQYDGQVVLDWLGY